MQIELIGIIGAILLIVAWIPEIKDIIKYKKTKLNKRFTELLFAATLILLAYSILKNDWVFTIINAFILLEVSISIYYSNLRIQKHRGP